jgi:hypothetical protein
MENAIPLFEPVTITQATHQSVRHIAAVIYLELTDDYPEVAAKWGLDTSWEVVTSEDSIPTNIKAPTKYLDFIQALYMQTVEIEFNNYSYDTVSLDIQRKYDDIWRSMYPHLAKYHQAFVDNEEHHSGWPHQPMDGFDLADGLAKSERLQKYC